VELRELRPGLWRWTAFHAEWKETVGSVAYEADDALLLVDPLVPENGWEELDTLVERHGRPVSVVTTIRFHGRSRDAVVARYEVTSAVPNGVETIPIEGAGETIVWLPGPRALVPGDRIIGADAGGLRLCPESWLRYLPSGMTRAQLREELRPLLDLPIELVLVSHGEPVLDGGREALARAIDSA
jgi:hypothetical protein